MTDIHALIVDRLDSSALLAGKLRDTAFDEAGEIVRGNYLLLFSSATPDRLVTHREARAQAADDDGIWSWTVRAVAVDPDGCRLLLADVFARLVGWQPEIPGRTPGRVRHDGSERIKPDTKLSPPLYFGEDDYSVRC